MFRFALLALHLVSISAKVFVITGATGRAGSLVYASLKKEGATVRAFIRNATKARERLGCKACDPSEGIFVGDVTKPETMTEVMQGADGLIITTGPAYHCTIPSIYVGCHFYPGADPKTMAWLSVRSQVSAFANATGPPRKQRHIMLLSNTLTTQPNNFLDKIDNSNGCFYALNGEADTMASGVPFTILKPAGLNDGEPGQKEIVVAHDDEGWSAANPNFEFIARSDLARLLTYAAMNPDKAAGLRFDVTSKRFFGTPTKDPSAVFAAAKYPWQTSRSTQNTVVV